MSGSEWVAVFAAQICLVLLVVLVVMIVRLDRAARDLRAAAADFRADAEPALEELRAAVRSADASAHEVTTQAGTPTAAPSVRALRPLWRGRPRTLRRTRAAQ